MSSEKKMSDDMAAQKTVNNKNKKKKKKNAKKKKSKLIDQTLDWRRGNLENGNHFFTAQCRHGKGQILKK